MQLADFIPASGIGAEIGRSLFLTAGLDLRQALQIALDQCVRTIKARQKTMRQIAANGIIGKTEIGPRPS